MVLVRTNGRSWRERSTTAFCDRAVMHVQPTDVLKYFAWCGVLPNFISAFVFTVGKTTAQPATYARRAVAAPASVSRCWMLLGLCCLLLPASAPATPCYWMLMPLLAACRECSSCCLLLPAVCLLLLISCCLAAAWLLLVDAGCLWLLVTPVAGLYDWLRLLAYAPGCCWWLVLLTAAAGCCCSLLLCC